MADCNENIKPSKLVNKNDSSKRMMEVMTERCFDDAGYDPGILQHRISQIESTNTEAQMIDVVSSKVRKKMTAEELANRLNISIKMA